MSGPSFGDDDLREKLAGHYVAWRNGEVVIQAETSDELYDQLNQMPRNDQADIVVEYVRRTDVVYIY